jgi:cytoskeletal protein CcmA (bactofilin family)
MIPDITGRLSRMAKIRLAQGVTLIAANTEVVGDVRFKDQLFVNGRVEGNVLAGPDEKATVVISEAGRVQGDIRVANVVINGEVEGDVYATARVELAARARVKGNVYYQLIEMQLGAMVDGQLLHDDGTQAGNVHPFPADAAGDADPARDVSRSANRH